MWWMPWRLLRCILAVLFCILLCKGFDSKLSQTGTCTNLERPECSMSACSNARGRRTTTSAQHRSLPRAALLAGLRGQHNQCPRSATQAALNGTNCVLLTCVICVDQACRLFLKYFALGQCRDLRQHNAAMLCFATRRQSIYAEMNRDMGKL